MPSDFDESSVQLSDPAALVQALAQRKAETILSNLSQQAETTDSKALVMGCDSVLAIHGEIHGKPANPADAIARWQQMRGQTGELYTGHALIEHIPDQSSPDQSNTAVRQVVRCQVTRVQFAQVSDRQIAAYVATGEPLNCAGCFALEGKGGLFVEQLHGCYTNVIGLSLPLLRQMLAELGYDVTDFWGGDD